MAADRTCGVYAARSCAPEMDQRRRICSGPCFFADDARASCCPTCHVDRLYTAWRTRRFSCRRHVHSADVSYRPYYLGFVCCLSRVVLSSGSLLRHRSRGDRYRRHLGRATCKNYRGSRLEDVACLRSDSGHNARHAGKDCSLVSRCRSCRHSAHSSSRRELLRSGAVWPLFRSCIKAWLLNTTG